MALVVSLPPDIPPQVELTRISGPWFFHGIQLLLRYCSPLLAGIVWPLVPFLLLSLLAYIPARYAPFSKNLVTITWLLQATFIITALSLVYWTGG